MLRAIRYLHVLLALALINHGGMFAVQASSMHAETAMGPADVQTTMSAAEPSAAEHDCHGHAATSAPQEAAAQQTPCEHDGCAYCLCAPTQPLSMTLILLPAGTQLEAELRTSLPGGQPAGPPALLLRPPIA